MPQVSLKPISNLQSNLQKLETVRASQINASHINNKIFTASSKHSIRPTTQKIKRCFCEILQTLPSPYSEAGKRINFTVVNGNQEILCQLRDYRDYTCWQHKVHAHLPTAPTPAGHNRFYLAIKLAWHSGHGALVLNNVHAVPCEVMYIAFH